MRNKGTQYPGPTDAEKVMLGLLGLTELVGKKFTVRKGAFGFELVKCGWLNNPALRAFPHYIRVKVKQVRLSSPYNALVHSDEYLNPTDRIWAWVGTEDLIHPSKK